MGREIKFRAWSLSRQRMLYRVLAGPGDPCSIVWDDERKDWLNFDAACGELMQFTGLSDKNGREIYEGDIVKGTNDMGVVAWYVGGWRVEMKLYWISLAEDLFEVLGNIYETPELLAEVNR